jgi:hypothetical protein
MIEIDDRYWPLVLYRFSGEVSLSELNEYLDRQDELLGRKQMTGSIVLTENLRMWDAAVLRRQAEWIRQHLDALRRYSIGAALVIQSPVVRGMLKAVLWPADAAAAPGLRDGRRGAHLAAAALFGRARQRRAAAHDSRLTYFPARRERSQIGEEHVGGGVGPRVDLGPRAGRLGRVLAERG